MKERTTRGIDGAGAERLAERLLKAQGLTLLKRNYRCRGGEIDLIMQHGDTLVFVEVRARSSQRHGGASASLDARKQQRLIRAASYFLFRNPGLARRPCRFDAVILQRQANGEIHHNWFRDAFRCDD